MAKYTYKWLPLRYIIGNDYCIFKFLLHNVLEEYMFGMHSNPNSCTTIA